MTGEMREQVESPMVVLGIGRRWSDKGRLLRRGGGLTADQVHVFGEEMLIMTLYLLQVLMWTRTGIKVEETMSRNRNIDDV